MLSPPELEEVTEYILAGCQKVLQFTPDFFSVSAKTGQDVDLLIASLQDLLSETERVALKLLGPQQTLLVFLEDLASRVGMRKEELAREQLVFDRVLARLSSRIVESDLFFEIILRR